MSDSVRLTKEGRREQLLDVAATLLLDQGTGALTMERLAQHAGVSKALPYVHFENSDGVLIELFRREVVHFGIRIAEAIDGVGEPEARLRAAVHAYFEVISERGAILAIVAGPGSPVPHKADDGSRVGNRFVAGLLEDGFDLTSGRALTVAAILLGALNGGIDAWVHGDGRRREIEEAIVSATLRMVET